jgi:hypothetical protein
MFRLDEDLSGFYGLVGDDPELGWCVAGAGRMLRAPTVFEDVVKTSCTLIRLTTRPSRAFNSGQRLRSPNRDSMRQLSGTLAGALP